MTDSPPVLAVGAAAIDEWYAVSNLPEPDGGAFASEVTTAFGGVGANVCVALDRLGREVGLVSRVGDDDDEWSAGLRVPRGHRGRRLARLCRERPSTRSVILSDPAGERTIVTTGESFRRLRLNETDREALAAADIVFLTGYTPDAVSRAVLDTIESGRSDPPALVFDLSGSVEELVGRGTESETIHRYLHAADLFVADDVVAAAAYFGGPDAAVDRVAAAQQAREANGRSPVTGDGWPRRPDPRRRRDDGRR